ncbi:DUF6356 family protein [uncultured Sphingomonas sp.]|uniref:DUF6356 family protein n=1 Tax=uncultured Sphingomonas sp. TaxID=158754 RepID=UPI0025E59366|nr:DUF6356 family protein [uncultured Sphingomonas sp.]
MLGSAHRHLAEAGESYTEHLVFASVVGTMLVGAGLACVLHALMPAICQRTASQTVQALTELFRDRSRLGAVASGASGSLVLVGLLALVLPLAVAVILLAQASVALPLALMLLAVPGAFLWSNPDLNPVG